MYLCDRCIDFASFYDFLLDFQTVPSVVFYVFHFIHISVLLVKKTTDLSQVTDKLYHIILYRVYLASSDRH
jgi:uncharacterized membrane protein